MNDYATNVYYNPNKSGLEIVGELEYSSGSYEFDTRVVWIFVNEESLEKRLLTARDSGCSCPIPFEDYSVSTLEDITNEYESFLRNERTNAPDYERENVSLEEVDALIEKCRKALL